MKKRIILFIVSIVDATLQNALKGTEGKAQRFVNSGAWFLVLLIILWILLLDWEAKSRFAFHAMYEALKNHMSELRKRKKNDGGGDIAAKNGDVEAGRGVVQKGDGNEKAKRTEKSSLSVLRERERKVIKDWKSRLEMIKERWRPQGTQVKRKWR